MPVSRVYLVTQAKPIRTFRFSVHSDSSAIECITLAHSSVQIWGKGAFVHLGNVGLYFPAPLTSGWPCDYDVSEEIMCATSEQEL